MSANARDRALLGLFALSLAWALLKLGVLLVLSGEGGALKDVAEWVPAVIAVAAAGAITALLVRLAPSVLRVPASVTSLRLGLSLIVTAVVVAAALLLIPLVVTMFVDPPGPRADVQYVPIGFWIAPWAAGALTPVITILIAWRWTRRSRSRGAGVL